MTLADRFWSKVEIGDWQDCWPWTAGRTTAGYGIFHPATGTAVYAHRYAYEELVQAIPDGLELDHVEAWGCSTTSCVNPLHLEAVTHRENVLRGRSPMAEQSRQTSCIHGHPYDEQNTYIRPDGRRDCRACNVARQRRRAAR